VLIGDPVSKSDECSIRDFEDDGTAAAIHMSLRRHPRAVLIGDPVSKSDGCSIRDFEDDVTA
jgi:hypothetical protein